MSNSTAIQTNSDHNYLNFFHSQARSLLIKFSATLSSNFKIFSHRTVHKSNRSAASRKRESPLERFENEGPVELSETAAREKQTHQRQKKSYTHSSPRNRGSRKARVNARRGCTSASIMRNRAFCWDKQKGETEADGALIASAIDVRDRFNLRRPSTCVWMSAGVLTSVCAPFRTSMFIEQESGI